jgi:integrase
MCSPCPTATRSIPRISTLFRRLSQACGLPPIRLHDLRHTSASLALQAGVSLKVVQETLRHQSIVLTVDTYISVLPEAAREAADATAELILAHGCRVPGATRTRRRLARPVVTIAA